MDMHPYQPVTLDDFDSAPIRFSNTIELDVSADQLFDVFEDENSWPQWVTGMDSAPWTSDGERAAGSTRTVSMGNGRFLADELFFVWERPHAMAFHFESASSGVMASFAERYQVTPVDDERCTLTWTVIQVPQGIGKVTLPLMKPVINLILKKVLTQLQAYAEDRFLG
ncbi:MAG: SRPBCC family protein [Pseudomonadota bacterium]